MLNVRELLEEMENMNMDVNTNNLILVLGSNEKQMLKGLVDKANTRIMELKTGIKPALKPDADANYFAEVIVESLGVPIANCSPNATP